jgi:hypothetical protein
VLPSRVFQIVSSLPTKAKGQEKLPRILRPVMKLPDVVPDLSVVVDTDTTAVINAH